MPCATIASYCACVPDHTVNVAVVGAGVDESVVACTPVRLRPTFVVPTSPATPTPSAGLAVAVPAVISSD